MGTQVTRGQTHHPPSQHHRQWRRRRRRLEHPLPQTLDPQLFWQNDATARTIHMDTTDGNTEARGEHGDGTLEIHLPSLVAGELGDGLGALGDGVLGELAGEDEADGGLDLPGRDGGLLVVPGQLGRLAGELLEDVVDEGVHDGHGLGGDADVRVHLLEHLEDVDLVGLHALLVLLPPLLVAALLGGLGRRQPLLRLGLLAGGGLLGLLRDLGGRLLLRGLLLGLGRHRSGLSLRCRAGVEGNGRVVARETFLWCVVLEQGRGLI
uniref:Uncharacterized protein n=1 Tax=Aegilops tauschii subsp. strangulata TaxID=200361 RepID=A0A453ID23_AEGTS